MNEVIKHYDLLIDENNDPCRESQIMKDYMNKWDGNVFIDLLKLDKRQSVLEIGIGTGRIAAKTVELCSHLTGIDISPKTIERAKENLKSFDNITLINSDFMKYKFEKQFDLIYQSLMFMHIKEKQSAINKIASLLNPNGRFVICIDKNQSDIIDMGIRSVDIYPDTPEKICGFIENTELNLESITETEFGYIICSSK